MNIQNLLKISAATLLLMLGVGCSDQSAQQEMVHRAVTIEQADECHLCGMIIKNYPGPKGENYSTGSDTAKKFCSTRDLFAYILQPENIRQVKEVYVHDMAKTPWEAPGDEHFIDARKAWFVIGSTQKGAMGNTLASFSEKSDAEAFIKEFGGTLHIFDEITIDMI